MNLYWPRPRLLHRELGCCWVVYSFFFVSMVLYCFFMYFFFVCFSTYIFTPHRPLLELYDYYCLFIVHFILGFSNISFFTQFTKNMKRKTLEWMNEYWLLKICVWKNLFSTHIFLIIFTHIYTWNLDFFPSPIKFM